MSKAILTLTIEGPLAETLESHPDAQAFLAQKIQADLWDLMGRVMGTNAPPNYAVTVETSPSHTEGG